MIKITRNDGAKTVILEVTQGAFENIYKQQGYVPLATATSPASPTRTAPEGEWTMPPKSDDDMFMDAVEMKPIAQWSNKELHRYAVLVNIDPKAKNLRETIKQVIESRK